MPLSRIAVGADIGHSSVKIAANHLAETAQVLVTQFPTVVRDHITLSNPASAKQAEQDTVAVDGRRYFIGRTAMLQGRAEDFTGQDRNWINSHQHDALILGAWDKAKTLFNASHGDNAFQSAQEISFCLGLPSSYFLQQKDQLRIRTLRLIEPRLSPGQQLRVMIQSQSMAPLLNISLDSSGLATGDINEFDAWGAIEIGHFTTDFNFQDRGQEIEITGGSASGVTMIYERVKAAFKQRGYLYDLETLSQAIATRAVIDYGKSVSVKDIVDPAIEEFGTYIKEEAGRRFNSSARRMNGIVIAGGGADIHGIGDVLKSMYGNTRILDNPRFSVANGLCRLGLAVLRG
mgnify:CR=1 FL=1